jgi:hypothetical protein
MSFYNNNNNNNNGNNHNNNDQFTVYKRFFAKAGEKEIGDFHRLLLLNYEITIINLNFF